MNRRGFFGRLAAALAVPFARPREVWTCEQHPSKEWPHDDCVGPGELRTYTFSGTDVGTDATSRVILVWRRDGLNIVEFER